MHQKSNQNLFTNCKSFLNECKKTLSNFLKMTLVTKQMRKMTNTVFFQNNPDEEKSDSEKSQEQSSKNDESDIEFGSDEDMEEGFPVENAYKGEEFEMEEEGDE